MGMKLWQTFMQEVSGVSDKVPSKVQSLISGAVHPNAPGYYNILTSIFGNVKLKKENMEIMFVLWM